MIFSFGKQARRRNQRGHAVVEVAVLSPWIFMLFAGTFDMGMYGYALMTTQNAARAAVVYTSNSTATAGSSSKACQYALAEMSSLPGVGGLTTCTAYPVIVTANSVAGADGATASEVTVTYRTPQLIPIPGLMGRLVAVRTVQMRCRQ
jgi:Flp pilus assembly protein TadG